MENSDPEDVELKIEEEPEPADDGKKPAPVVEPDPAAEAFARLEGELALMRRAVQHLVTERADAVVPDYSATLAEMAKRMGTIDEDLKGISGHPAMQLTPDLVAKRLAAAVDAARRAEEDRASHALRALHSATETLCETTARARTAAWQREQLRRVAAGGMATGMLLWSFLPGTIARALPERWHWPEKMAARIVGESNAWSGGIRMMQAGDPASWSAIVEASRLEEANRAVIKRCIKDANAQRQIVQCRLRVSPRPE